MRGQGRTRLGALLISWGVAACGAPPSVPRAEAQTPPAKSAAEVRAERRAYDGAPPVIPHPNLGAACTSCHHERGVEVQGLGFAPRMPHANTDGLSDVARCVQCHVFQTGKGEFRPSGFVGLRQDLRKGARASPGAPPVIPHLVQLREQCVSCHDGPAAREAIRTPHPERARCRQCHLEQVVEDSFPAGR
jgi:cytochrome c-type protein NapB